MTVHLVWAAWGADEATGIGMLEQDACPDDCAGTVGRGYPARVELSEPVVVGHTSYFTRVTLRFADQSPTGKAVEVLKDCFDPPPHTYLPRCPADLQGAG